MQRPTVAVSGPGQAPWPRWIGRESPRGRAWVLAGLGLVVLAGAGLPASAQKRGQLGGPPPGARQFGRPLALEDSGFTSANASVGDVNGDGHLDVLLVKGRHWPLRNLVLLGTGQGTFRPPVPVDTAADRSYSGVLVDLDGDGSLDLVVSNDSPDPKKVYRNDGTGHYTLVTTFGRPEWSTRHVAVGDINGDGIPDVVL
ncbi:MAG: FG-GAP repeat domain-containing protein, partial [Gemmatimonadales bacterium]